MAGPALSTTNAASAMEQCFALDVQGTDSLRRAARQSPEEGLRQVARQFEALFMGMMLKSMREATPSSGLLDGQNHKLYQSMLDQQLAQHLSGRGLKLADAMFAQLRRNLPQQSPPVADGQALASPVRSPAAMPAPVAASHYQRLADTAPAAHRSPLPSDPSADASSASRPGMQTRVREFIAKLGDAAGQAAEATGLSQALILAQAALESAWGQREVPGAEGRPTFNLFGIKADASWRGRVAETDTTEFIDGVRHRVKAKFRAYDSYEEAFADYAKFLTSNRRYGLTLAEGDPVRAAHALQRAGYATDPDYASKLIRVMKLLVAA